MKNVLVLFIMLNCSAIVYSQSGPSFPNKFFFQEVVTLNSDGLGYSIIEEATISSYDFDSVFFSGKWWKLIYDEYTWDTLGFYRVDSNQVFYKNHSMLPEIIDTAEFIIYDFSLLPGDTAYITEDDIMTEYVTVEDIGNSTIFGYPALKLDLSNGDKWIYGLGSIEGFYSRWKSHFENSFHICYFEGIYVDESLGEYEQYYEEQGYPCTLGLNVINSKQTPMVVMYNSYVTIEVLQEENMKIFNLSGQLLIEANLKPGINSISLEYLPLGVYILQVNDDFPQKIVHY